MEAKSYRAKQRAQGEMLCEYLSGVSVKRVVGRLWREVGEKKRRWDGRLGLEYGLEGNMV